jgi:hypothetical protein
VTFAAFAPTVSFFASKACNLSLRNDFNGQWFETARIATPSQQAAFRR